MLTYKGYAIEQHIKKNRVVIYLPQTMETLTSTVSEPKTRRMRLSDAEMAMLLKVAVSLYEEGER